MSEEEHNMEEEEWKREQEERKRKMQEEERTRKMEEEERKREEEERKRVEESRKMSELKRKREQESRMREDKENIFLQARAELTDTRPFKNMEERLHVPEPPTDLKMFQEDVVKRLTTIERLLRRMLKGSGDGSTCDSVPAVKKEEDPQYTYNGTPLLTVMAKDAVAYGRRLLDMMFSKAEQKMSLVHKTHAKKSSKPMLDQAKVKLLMDCVKIRYPEHETQKLLCSLYQKCRDAKLDNDIDITID